jgi:hypothetical protein
MAGLGLAVAMSTTSTAAPSPQSTVFSSSTSPWQIDPCEISLGPRIGIGSYSEVYKGSWRGTEVAVKRILEQNISPQLMKEFIDEVELMARLRHPNIVLFMGAVTQVSMCRVGRDRSRRIRWSSSGLEVESLIAGFKPSFIHVMAEHGYMCNLGNSVNGYDTCVADHLEVIGRWESSCRESSEHCMQVAHVQ